MFQLGKQSKSHHAAAVSNQVRREGPLTPISSNLGSIKKRLQESAQKRRDNLKTHASTKQSLPFSLASSKNGAGVSSHSSPALQSIKNRLNNSARKRRERITSSPPRTLASTFPAHTETERGETALSSPRNQTINSTPEKRNVKAKVRILVRSNLNLAKHYIQQRDFKEANQIYSDMESSEIINEAKKYSDFWFGRIIAARELGGTKGAVLSLFKEAQISTEGQERHFVDELKLMLLENDTVALKAPISPPSAASGPNEEQTEEDATPRSPQEAIRMLTNSPGSEEGLDADTEDAAFMDILETGNVRSKFARKITTSVGKTSNSDVLASSAKELPTSYVCMKEVKLRGADAKKAGATHAVTQVRRSARLLNQDDSVVASLSDMLANLNFSFKPNPLVAESYFAGTKAPPKENRRRKKTNPNDKWKYLGTRPGKGYQTPFLQQLQWKVSPAEEPEEEDDDSC